MFITICDTIFPENILSTLKAKNIHYKYLDETYSDERKKAYRLRNKYGATELPFIVVTEENNNNNAVMIFYAERYKTNKRKSLYDDLISFLNK